MLDLTVIKTQLQTRIDALTNGSTLDDILDIAIAAKQAELIGVKITRTNLDTQLQRIANAVTAGSPIEDLIVIAASLKKEDDAIIGEIREFIYRGDKFTDEKGREWLREGKLHTVAGYDEAYAIAALRSYGREVYVPTSKTITHTPRQCARDGLGNLVIACGSSDYVLVSHDNGNTILLVEHNHDEPVTGVVFVGTHFILASNTATELKTSYSSDGGSNFGSVTVARTLVSATPDSVAGAASATTALFVAAGTTAAVTMANGATKTSRTLVNTPISGNHVLICAHGTTLIVASTGTSTYQKTTDGGATFSSSNPGKGTPERIFSHIGKFYWSGSGTLYRTSDLVSWEDMLSLVPVELTYNSINSYNGSFSTFPVKNGFILGNPARGYFLYTQDFISYSRMMPSQTADELTYGGTNYFEVFGDLLTATSSSDFAAKILKFDVDIADYIGVGSLNYLFNRKPNYLRIK
jgi:hypothetical protein